MIDSAESEVIVAEIDNEIIASGYVKYKSASPYLKHTHYGYLGFMYVKPEYRGQRINKQIIDELKKRSRTNNITELRLDVYNDNDSALKAYEKAGFKKHLINMRIEID